jgi:hypothetical protein
MLVVATWLWRNGWARVSKEEKTTRLEYLTGNEGRSLPGNCSGFGSNALVSSNSTCFTAAASSLCFIAANAAQRLRNALSAWLLYASPSFLFIPLPSQPTNQPTTSWATSLSTTPPCLRASRSRRTSNTPRACWMPRM